jgi:hypothetical protein
VGVVVVEFQLTELPIGQLFLQNFHVSSNFDASYVIQESFPKNYHFENRTLGSAQT